MPAAQPCPQCGRQPGPYRFLYGWQPCRCGGHRTEHCRSDKGGCGYTELRPPRGDRCGSPHQSHSAT